jgi:cytochrome c553
MVYMTVVESRYARTVTIVSPWSRCPSCRRQSPYERPGWRRLSAFVVARDGERGANHPANLVALCASCHGRLDAEWRYS